MSAQAFERIAASPYARRLARERGISLAGRRGSGPNGRIVAADLAAMVLPAAVAAPAEPPAAAPPVVSQAELAQVSPAPMKEAAPQRSISGFATGLDLSLLRALLPTIVDVAPDVTIDDLVLKAIGRALRVADLPVETIDWRDKAAAVQAIIPRADGLAPSRIAALRSGTETDAARGASIIVSRIRQDGLRPVTAALDPNVPIRLTLAVAEADIAEALIVFDEAEITDAAAAQFLAALRDCLAVPLRLLV
ncbi:E3 binding domain-containing protein [Mesorhizobium sp. BR1-1-16]|uniref:E3 binding domain-containing protein n=1 Tax=Mesorhizobium sp. BR1-1-16 TaxID=2876653 RepID=UPI001CCBC17B|nr:E3 binding domain-containing protein [Mesorhizobium sp. BR1-1-16]MBZ9938419.1 E3 binding domain-containing protein [Mesorhizobium sp. BR1-1-16]